MSERERWLSPRQAVEEGYAPSLSSLYRWGSDPRIAFPLGTLVGPNTRRIPLSEIKAWRDRRRAVDPLAIRNSPPAAAQTSEEATA